MPAHRLSECLSHCFTAARFALTFSRKRQLIMQLQEAGVDALGFYCCKKGSPNKNKTLKTNKQTSPKLSCSQDIFEFPPWFQSFSVESHSSVNKTLPLLPNSLQSRDD